MQWFVVNREEEWLTCLCSKCSRNFGNSKLHH